MPADTHILSRDPTADRLEALLRQLEAAAVAARQAYCHGHNNWHSVHLMAVTALIGEIRDASLDVRVPSQRLRE